MKKELPGYAIGIAAVLVLALIGYFGYRTLNPPGGQTGVSREEMQQRMRQSGGQARPGGGGPQYNSQRPTTGPGAPQ